MQVYRTAQQADTAVELLEASGYRVVKGWTEQQGSIRVTKLQKGAEVVTVRQLKSVN